MSAFSGRNVSNGFLWHGIFPNRACSSLEAILLAIAKTHFPKANR